ncbi:SGO_0316/SGO_0317 family LPXTG-anchored serine peptidase [Streptococcus parasanguinis]|uniref:SGO_0316/SGO_0317 family LPXTG-anchored serine peptidase n=1 Tax=Streptococcus parasanguinis TaxID=1318 RepID=UPI00214FF198|nr:SGO_0316/SGO_0317 family LPXTG-anchored serine peptidase [Streptococcus parasanguinis]MCR4487138.1 SGO_0316/SGO_0317 family LPXTG-anchored serine peptidase [Streptococcus parasanguinis]
MEFHRQQRFSIRKYAIGVASVLIGTFLMGSAVSADTIVPTPSVVEPSVVVPETAATDEKTAEPIPATKDSMPTSVIEDTASKNLATAEIESKEKTNQSLPSSSIDTSSSATNQVEAEKASPSVAEAPKENGVATPITTSIEPVKENLEETSPVEVLVRLKEKVSESIGEVSPTSKETRIEKTNQDHEQFLKELEKQSIQFKKLYDFNLLFNGLALETTYGDAKKIRGLARVDAVDYAPLGRTRVAETQPTPTSPTSTTTKVSEENSLINLQPLWDKGIKGQGQVVAIIDSGVDPAHDVFRLTDISKAKYKSEAEIEEAKKKAGITYGKWYNNKIVYIHNYSDMDDNVKEDDPISHGAHVAGTAVGNASQPSPNGEIIRGVAPEAQLMFLRVFSDTKGGQVQNFIYTKAVEDAVKLGADSINMSLGTASGSVYDVGEITRQAFDTARKAGVTITVASTNMATNGFWHSKPLATTPDYGMTGTPSVNPNVISVASINSLTKHESTEASLTVDALKDSKDFPEGKIPMHSFVERDAFRTTIPQSYLHVEKGGLDHYQSDSINGHLVLTERGGEVSDVDKVKELKRAGATGVIFYQTEEQGNNPVGFDLEGLGERFPVGVIGHAAGLVLAQHANDYQLHIANKFKRVPYDAANQLSDFSSWGLSADGDLKPDVTLPGGMIYSSVNNGEYYMDRGTSMASPHAAGATVLVKQALKERFPHLSPEQLQVLVKQMTMSTAIPHVDEETHAYSSVRQQGAGVMDVTAAALGDLYVTAKDAKSSLTLGNVTDTFEFDVTIHNLSNQDKSVRYETTLQTDQVQDGKFTLHPRLLETLEGKETVTIPANGQRTIHVAVDASKYKEELSKQMPNGYFLEGFVLVKDASTQKHLVSLPYVGFHGDYQNLRGIEKPIYEYTGSDKPFYYYKDKTDYPDEKVPETPERHPDNHFTSLISYVYENGESVAKTLGQDGDRFDGDQLYFSPNNDSSFDSVKVKAVMLRNVENVHLSVYKKDDTARSNPIYEVGNEVHRKTDWSYRIGNRSEEFYEISWEGLDKDGKQLPDGEYQFVITYRPTASGAKQQELNFKVKIDNTAPSIESGSAQYDPATRIFRPGKVLETGSGLAGTYLSYVKDGETVALEPQEDGSYLLPEGVDPSTVRYTIWDKVYNTTEMDIEGKKVEATTPTNETSSDEQPSETESEKPKAEKGTLEVVFTDSSGEVISYYPSVVRYQVVDDQGRVVEGEFNASYNGGTFPDLPFGTYTAKITLSDYHYDWGTELVKKVTVSPENPHPKVTFAFHYLDENKLTIGFDQPVPAGTVVKVVGNDGISRILPQSIYDLLRFETMLMNGSYRVHVDLPAGYRVAENDFLYEVSNRINYHLLSLVKDVIKPNPEVHSGAIVEPWIQPENPTLVIDEVPSRHSETPVSPDQLAVSKGPVTPTQPAASETKEVATNKPVAVTYHTGGQAEVVATPATGLPKTGQDELASTVLSLFGMTSLAFAGFVASKKREG